MRQIVSDEGNIIITSGLSGDYCESGYYYIASTGNNDDTCNLHSTSCDSGQYISAEGTDTSDIQCTVCTRPDYTAADASLTCSSTNNNEDTIRIVPNTGVGGTNTYCASGYFHTVDIDTNNSTCTQHSGCPTGQYISIAGDDTNDDTCTVCTRPDNTAADASLTCSSTNNNEDTIRIVPNTGVGGTNTYCASGYFHTLGIDSGNSTCTQHSGCPTGQYISTAGDDNNNDICTPCPTVDNAAPGATYTCTTASDSQVSACADGFYKDSSGAADVCTACSTVTNAASDATYTCSSATNSRVSSCADGFYKDGSSNADVCSSCTAVNNVGDYVSYTCDGPGNTRIILGQNPSTGITGSYCQDNFYYSPGSDASGDDPATSDENVFLIVVVKMENYICIWHGH